jgi:hypothetical protein
VSRQVLISIGMVHRPNFLFLTFGMFYSRLPMPQLNAPSMSMSNPVNDIQNPGSASEAISIQTDVPPRRYADIMNSDVPDLTYDYDYDCDFSTPHSASSSHMIPTPVFDWNLPLGDKMFDGKTHYSPLLETYPPSSVCFIHTFLMRLLTAFTGSPVQSRNFSRPGHTRWTGRAQLGEAKLQPC